jgi:hypothetical protein
MTGEPGTRANIAVIPSRADLIRAEASDLCGNRERSLATLGMTMLRVASVVRAAPVILSVAKDLMPLASGDEILRCAQDDNVEKWPGARPNTAVIPSAARDLWGDRERSLAALGMTVLPATGVVRPSTGVH